MFSNHSLKEQKLPTERKITMNKRKIITAILTAACIVSAGSCGGSTGRPDTTASSGDSTTTTAASTTTTPPATLNEEQKEAVDEIEVELPELENKEVRLLACFDLNPDEGKVKSVALEMFETKLGGKIVTDKCAWGSRYDKLSTYVTSGDSPDMFSAEDLDIIPGKVLAGAFQSMDKYVDYDSELWAPVKDLNDQFSLNGRHYLGLTSTDAGTVMIYNKKTIEENGLDDPAKLVEEGNWTWDTLYDMLSMFCSPGDGKYGLDCWEFEPNFALTCGVPYIGLKDGKLVSNLEDPMIMELQDYFVKLKRAEMPFPKSDNNWQEAPERIKTGDTLFFGKGAYALFEPQTLAQFGEMEDIMFVPMPACPKADAWYLPSVVKGFAIPTGAKNPEGTAAYLNCVMICRDNEKVLQIEKDQLFDDYGWTDEMYDMLLTTRELTAAHPVFDYMKTVNDNVYDLINNPSKESYNQGTPWTESVEEIKFAVQSELDAANEKLAALTD